MNELIPTDPSSDSEAVIRHDNRLNDAVGFLRTIEEGRGSPEDLVNYVELSAGYYVDQLKDPVKAADPVFQEAALHHHCLLYTSRCV